MKSKQNHRGFTLIELLIVVAIIAILAAIAVPNFLEAQVRAKVSRAKADMRSTLTAIEAYAVDNNRYAPPIGFEAPSPFTIADPADEPFEGFVPYRITTPVGYITALPLDLFEVKDPTEHPPKVQWHYSEQSNNELLGEADFIKEVCEKVWFQEGAYRYFIFSHGPDLTHQADATEGGEPTLYDPTNGTVSVGDIYTFGPGGSFR